MDWGENKVRMKVVTYGMNDPTCSTLWSMLSFYKNLLKKGKGENRDFPNFIIMA